MIKSQTVERKTEMEYPPSSLWIDPAGDGQENPAADKLSWELAVRSGFADRLAGQVAAQKPLVEKLRGMVRLGRIRKDPLEVFVLLEREKRLAELEPELVRTEALLKFCESWVGKGAVLEARLRETEAALKKADAAAQEHAQARAVVLAAAPDASKAAMAAALEPADRAVAARVGVARSANDAARAAVAEKQTWIANAERRLASLRRKASAVA